MVSGNVGTTLVCPLLGVILANSMWLSPIIAMQKARESGSLGNLNPVPFSVIVINCIGWTFFSIVTQDYFVFFANMTGVVLGLYLTISSLYLLGRDHDNKSNQQNKLYIESIIIGGVTFWLIIVLICGIILDSSQLNTSKSIVGGLSCACAVCYYAAPLSTLMEILRTKDASSLYFPTILVNLTNALLWFFYGLIGIYSVSLWVPNGLGAIISLVQLSFIFIFRRGKHTSTERKDIEAISINENEDGYTH